MSRTVNQEPGAETDRTIGDLLRVGLVQSVDLAAGKAVVSFGSETTPPIDWLMSVGDTTIWIAPTVGQQVLVATPEGDVEQAIIVGALPSSQFAPLFEGAKVAIRFNDGALIKYDPDAHLLHFQTPGSATVTAPDGFALIGDLSVTGKITATDIITSDADVVAAGKSLKSHKHTGVATGGGVSGPPQ